MSLQTTTTATAFTTRAGSQKDCAPGLGDLDIISRFLSIVTLNLLSLLVYLVNIARTVSFSHVLLYVET